jgi:hypothetical protein
VPLPVRGSDLGVEPGPHIAHALDDTRIAIFLGEISPADAAGFARSRALHYLRSAGSR